MKKYNVIVVFDCEMEKTLMCKRAKEPYLGMYNLVGGKIEKEHDGLNEAYRELREETNISEDDINLTHFMNIEYVSFNKSLEVYYGTLNKEVELVEEVNKLVKGYDDDAIIAGEGPLMKDLTTISDTDFKNVNYLSIAIIFILMLFVLKSVSLPIILVTAIEFAIFVNMGISFYTNDTLPFIASIVIGTIQLGATIDYAILMSTKYIEERKTNDKKKAMEITLENTVPSIITSALCFFAATVGVYMYSKIDMIGAICKLLSRGSIISMLVVVLILPSLLIIFDKIICKTTKGLKEAVYEKNK